MKRITAKLRSHSGESISETLIALLIVLLSLTMLTGAISAASGLVLKSKDKIKKYYTVDALLVNDDTSSSVDNYAFSDVTITLTETTSSGIASEEVGCTYYENTVFTDRKPVISYAVGTESNEELP